MPLCSKSFILNNGFLSPVHTRCVVFPDALEKENETTFNKGPQTGFQPRLYSYMTRVLDHQLTWVPWSFLFVIYRLCGGVKTVTLTDSNTQLLCPLWKILRKVQQHFCLSEISFHQISISVC